MQLAVRVRELELELQAKEDKIRAALEQRCERTGTQLDASTARAEALEAKVAELTKELEHNRAMHSHSERRRMELELELETRRADSEKLAAAEERAAALQAELDARRSTPCACAQALLAAEREDVAAFRSRNAELEASIASLQAENAELEKRHATAQQMFEELVASNAQARAALEQKLAEVEAEVHAAKAEARANHQLAAQVPGLKDQIVALAHGCGRCSSLVSTSGVNAAAVQAAAASAPAAGPLARRGTGADDASAARVPAAPAVPGAGAGAGAGARLAGSGGSGGGQVVDALVAEKMQLIQMCAAYKEAAERAMGVSSVYLDAFAARSHGAGV